MPSENLVEIQELNFTYDVRPVLQGINMNFPRGKVVAIMGLAGCGKTTLLRLIGGQLKPSSGRVQVTGKRFISWTARVYSACGGAWACCFSLARFIPICRYSTTWRFRCASTPICRKSMIRDLVLMKLQAVGLRGAHNLMPSELSGGMARRVALARAIALDPMLIMYDEPFAGLDPISLGVIGNLIRAQRCAGATSIVVTHDVQESLEDRRLCILFHVRGRMVAARARRIRCGQADRFVHQFVRGEIGWPGAPSTIPAPDLSRRRPGAGCQPHAPRPIGNSRDRPPW